MRTIEFEADAISYVEPITTEAFGSHGQALVDGYYASIEVPDDLGDVAVKLVSAALEWSAGAGGYPTVVWSASDGYRVVTAD